MNQKLSRRVFAAVKDNVLITSKYRYYEFNRLDISAVKTNVRLTSKDTEESKMFNSIKTLIALVNKYDEFKQAGMIIWLLGYYSFILNRNLDVKRHFKLFKEVQTIYAQQLNFGPNEVQTQRLRESMEQIAYRLNEQVSIWSSFYQNLNRRNGE
uniref:Uncharacterized protein n=1 Tax=Myoviridae sp. ctJ2i1 TaxID=2825079 RepID=A0A8S5V261_9CAUD|nr:MAG TPA: hypothetical protein [Myoviridae sp. ctJ2i1]